MRAQREVQSKTGERVRLRGEWRTQAPVLRCSTSQRNVELRLYTERRIARSHNVVEPWINEGKYISIHNTFDMMYDSRFVRSQLQRPFRTMQQPLRHIVIVEGCPPSKWFGFFRGGFKAVQVILVGSASVRLKELR